MNLHRYLDIATEVRSAVEAGKPVVALESTILSQCIPYPQNLAFSAEVEQIVRSMGAVPATIAIIDGRMKIGLSAGERELICRGGNVRSVSRRDLPIILAEGGTGSTSVASTMILASLAGIRVFSSVGLGGVHRDADRTLDISADLQELARTPMVVVCAGARSFLDIGATLEYLETMGVPVLGYKTNDFPAFYCRSSGFGVDRCVECAADAARIARIKWDLGLQGGVLIGNPVPQPYALDEEETKNAVDAALASAREKGIRGAELTPYLLAKLDELTDHRSMTANIQLAYNNARVAAALAIELSHNL